ncbi:hypothetical protein ACIRU8_28460 [Streptomyces sp. NPDC101175]|uniref:hypothetical protein n=1 Tax=Streptomyces sp. NPDC101175 TaxID=3366123 RepID=UPI003836D53B
MRGRLPHPREQEGGAGADLSPVDRRRTGPGRPPRRPDSLLGEKGHHSELHDAIVSLASSLIR